MSENYSESRQPRVARTVSVRVAVAVDPEGDWSAYGWGTLENNQKNDKINMSIALELTREGESRFFLTAELPVPDVDKVAEEIPATVEPVEQKEEGL